MTLPTSGRPHPRPSRLLVATTNAHKAEEIRALLQVPGVEIVTLPDLPGPALPVAEEDGETFEENAKRKALHYARLSNLPTLADDSGLCIDLLGGRPGKDSARWMGEATPYSVKNDHLLDLLGEAGIEERTARFVCVGVVAWPDGRCVSSKGVAEGRIHDRVDGSGGFGYDPVFWSFEGEGTFGSLPSEVKNRISHRAKAMQTLADLLRDLPAPGAR